MYSDLRAEMYRFASDREEFSEKDLEELRARIRKISDEALMRFGKAGRSLCRAASVCDSARRGKERVAATASEED